MPFTPFHLGPGAAFKAVGAPHFSFLVFGGSQVLMDIEPLIRLLSGEPVVHGISHSFVGAIAIGAISAVTGRPISNLVLSLSRVRHRPITWRAAWIAAFAGTVSHVLLDAVMHPDMAPLWPFAAANPFLGLMSMPALHAMCVALGIVGILGILLLRFARRTA